MRKVFKNITREELIEAFTSSQTNKQVLSKLGFSYHSKNLKSLQKICKELLVPQQFKRFHAHNRIPDDQIFIENSPYVNNRVNLRLRCLEAGYLENKCYECGLEPFWNGKPLVLQLDHINGVPNDHRLCNLRLLCPNCHTQTFTFAGKNRRIMAAYLQREARFTEYALNGRHL